MTIKAQLDDGRVLEFPDGTDPSVIQSTVKKVIAQSQPSIESEQPKIAEPEDGPSFLDSLVGGVEGAAQLGTGLIAEPIAGLVGLAGASNPFAEDGIGARNVEAVREFLTFQPRTEAGKTAAQPIGEALKPAVDKLEKVKQFLGDDAFESTGSPALAAIASTIPDAILEAIGGGVSKSAAKQSARSVSKNIAKKSAVKGIDQLEDATGIRRLTTDIFPPESRTGKFLQQQGEFVAPAQRTAQQAERVKAIDDLLTQFDVSDGARFESRIVEGVKSSIGQQKKAAGLDFERVVSQFDGFGDVSIPKTRNLASQIVDKELRKGALADNALISQMQNFIDAPENLKFSDVKSIRSAIGNNLQKAKALAPVVGTSDTGILSQLYKEISGDMTSFAKKSDSELAKEWRLADKSFSDFATGSNKAGVKSIIKRGDATPEVVDQLLFSTKNSDVEFLMNNIDAQGKQAAKQRVLQRFLEKSSPDGVTINPDKFATQLSKFRNQVGKVFDADERRAVVSIRDALNDTRRAQSSAVASATGQSVVPLFALSNPTVLIPGVAQAIIERPALRNLILKRKAAKTAKQRFEIDKQLQAEIDKAGLAGASTTGSLTPSEEEEQ